MKYLTYLLLISSSRAIKIQPDKSAAPNFQQLLEVENTSALEAAEKIEADFYAQKPEENFLIQSTQDDEFMQL